MQSIVTIKTERQGLIDISSKINNAISSFDVKEGMCNIFIQHTSASLTIQENADYSAKRDLESWINREVPENHPDYTHTHEGADDMPSHIKSVITDTSLNIPVRSSTLMLGTWQGVYLWEHRCSSHTRKIVVTLIK